MDQRESPDLEEIKHNLERLKTLDDNFKVFGAQQHQYKSYPLSKDEIIDLEGKIGVRLPNDYRVFLQVIGHGAGPYYGLFSPKEILSALFEEDSGGKSSDWPPKPGQPFPISQADIEKCIQKRNQPWVQFPINWPANGCIPICCVDVAMAWIYLVTLGELEDSVVQRNSTIFSPVLVLQEGWVLAPQPSGILSLHRYSCEPMHAMSVLPTFLEWYNAWLDQCLSDFDELRNLG